MSEPYGTGNVFAAPDPRDEIARLRAELAARDAEIDRLRLEYEPESMTPEAMAEWARHQVPAREHPRTDAEWRAADRKKRINDLAARYAGQIVTSAFTRGDTVVAGDVVAAARTLAAAVVEAEE